MWYLTLISYQVCCKLLTPIKDEIGVNILIIAIYSFKRNRNSVALSLLFISSSHALYMHNAKQTSDEAEKDFIFTT